MRDFRQLEVWNLGIKFVSEVYLLTRGLPDDERYGLTSQIRRAAVSVSANLAEGSGRESDSEMLRFVRIAMGSLNEVETMLVVIHEVGYMTKEQLAPAEQRARDLGVRLRNFARKLETDLGQRRASDASPTHSKRNAP